MAGVLTTRKCIAAAVAVCILWCAPVPPRRAGAQARATYDEGAVGLGLLLRRLQTTASVLNTGAHPDDEDSGRETVLLAPLARGGGARVAYLSLTRGEGGQNRIGPELFDALGVIRTEELLQARKLDGGEQFFTRAYDFGFTKTLEETKRRWNERALLADMVRVIRTFRPLVVVSRWRGTPADGHGQHQFAGYLTPTAFRAAADPTQFPEQLKEGLRPWQARKLYVSASAAEAARDPAGSFVRLDTGRFDPLLGRSYYEVAMEGRSQHKSQAEAGLELRGPQTTLLRLIATAPDAPRSGAPEQSIFDGLDTSIGGIARSVGLNDETITDALTLIERDAATALAKYSPLDLRPTVEPLADGLRRTHALYSVLTDHPNQAAPQDPKLRRAREEVAFMLRHKASEFGEALRLATGVRVDALADAEAVAPGESFTVAVRAFVPDARLATVSGLSLNLPQGWRAELVAPPQKNDALGLGREAPQVAQYFRVTVPADAQPTQPYWLRRPRRGDMYEWDKGDPQGLPFGPAPLRGEAAVEFGGLTHVITQPVQYRLLDAVRGELRREVSVVPALTVEVDPSLLIVPAGARAAARQLVVQLDGNAQAPIGGRLEVRAPGTPGFVRARPAQVPFTVKGGGRAAISFDLRFAPPPPRGQLRYSLSASVSARATTPEGQVFSLSRHVISYPHIQTHRYYTAAETSVRAFELKVAPVRVGYVMGSGDEVPDAIRRMGLDVTMLDERALSVGDLTRFDTIVVGVRASQTRPDFVANHARLMEWVRRGGALIVQYQRPDYARQNLPPYPARMEVPPQEKGGSPAISRVADEAAPITLLRPAHPLFNFPNRITPEDWRGWVQERNLYNFTAFDPRYTPLLEAHDAGEPPNSGGEVYARLGRGHYVYTSYAWFRQLPAGVPGAYRLFANLLSLPKATTTRLGR